jgi:Protein of unknown function (DUF3072)
MEPAKNLGLDMAWRLLYVYSLTHVFLILGRPVMDKKDQPAQTLKHPEQWATGNEPMTTAQDSYVHTLAREAGEDVPEQMTKAEASEKIDQLQEKTGRRTTSQRQPTRKKAGGRKKR